MALTKREIVVILNMTRKGAHPTLLAGLLRRDPRVVLDTLAAFDMRGPWPEIPKSAPSPALRAHARAILKERTKLSARHAVESLQGGDRHLSPNNVNLLIKTVIEEREELAAETEAN